MSEPASQVTPSAAVLSNDALLEVEKLLQQTDYILEPGAGVNVKRFLGHHGFSQEMLTKVIEWLTTDHYTGYGQMASLMCNWLALLDGGEGTSRGDAAKEPEDEFHFLKEFVKARFDPEHFAGMFTSRMQLTWLDALLAHERGRKLVYELSAVHRSSLLLNFAIQKVMQQGHQDEVASVGSSLASYFSVFHRLLSTRLQAAVESCRMVHEQSLDTRDAVGSDGGDAAGRSFHVYATAAGRAARSAGASTSGRGTGAPGKAMTLPMLSKELFDSCAGSQHTYLHAQQLLRFVACQPGGHGSVFAKLSEQLELSTAEVQPAAWSMMRYLLPMDSPPSAMEAAAVVAKLLAAPGPHLSSPDVLKLWRMYDSADSPPLGPIQHAHLLQLLISSVFSGRTLPAELQTACLGLLAAASSSQDSSMEHEHDILEDEADVQERRMMTRTALKAVLVVLQKAHGKMTEDDVAAAYAVADVPVAALGLLHAVRQQLGHREYYSEPSALSAAAIFLRLMMMVAQRRPELVPQVVSVIGACLEVQGSQRADLSRQFIDALVVLMRDLGAVEEVMAAINTWSEQADPSMVRAFIFQLLSVLSPPYSPNFAAWLIGHMTTSGVQRARDLTRGSHNWRLLEEFGRTALELEFVPQLPAKEAAVLQQLASGRLGPTAAY